jgi:hypothetical protein
MSDIKSKETEEYEQSAEFWKEKWIAADAKYKEIIAFLNSH